MFGFPLSGWLLLVIPPILMILAVAIFYYREVKRERLEDELLKQDREENQ